MKNREESGKNEKESEGDRVTKTEQTSIARPKLVLRPPLLRALDQLADSLEAELKRLNQT